MRRTPHPAAYKDAHEALHEHAAARGLRVGLTYEGRTPGWADREPAYRLRLELYRPNGVDRGREVVFEADCEPTGSALAQTAVLGLNFLSTY